MIFVAVVLVVVVVVVIIRLLLYLLSGLLAGLAAIAHAVGSFVASFGLDIVAAIVAIGLLWIGWWLVSELCYLLWYRRAERRWFEAAAAQVKAAMAPGNGHCIAGLGVPPRAAGFGRYQEHRLTPPLPDFLEHVVDHATQAAGSHDAGPVAEDLGYARTAELTLVSSLSDPGRSRRARTAATSQQRRKPATAASEDFNGLTAHRQLSRVRELVADGTQQSTTVLMISGDVDPYQLGRAAQGAGFRRCRTTDLALSLLQPPQENECHRHVRSTPHRERPAGRGRVEVTASNGVQVGDRCRQDNVYTYEVTTPRFADLADRLRDADVRAATRRLAAEPENPKARRELLDNLSAGRMPLGGPTSRVKIGVMRGHTTRSGSWLDGTVFFRDVSGGQIGDSNRQRNDFVYAVTPNTQARDLLAGNRALAKAVIDCAIPERGRGDAARLGRELRSAVEGMRITPPDGRVRSARYSPPEQARTLKIHAHDGVSVGRHSTVTRTDTVKARTSPDFSLHRLPEVMAREAPVSRAADRADINRASRGSTAIGPSRMGRGTSR